MRIRVWIVAAVVLPLAVSGCSLPGSDRAGAPPPAATAAPASPADPASPASPAPAREPAARDPRPGPLARATFNAGGKRSAEVEVLALKRRGKLLDLVLSITPHSEGESYVSVEAFTGAGPAAITLVDNVRLKRYLIVRDSENRPLQPPYWIIKIGEASVRTYTFPAPEAGVTKLDVSVGSEPPFRDVPVTS